MIAWMKLTTPNGIVHIAIENDVVVDVSGMRHLRLHADDTLSQWARKTGGTLERVDEDGRPL